ncbi:MAG: GrpB family protein [Gemmatimonas sp.]
MKQVRVVDYDPQWLSDFATVRDRVWPALADVAIAVEHVGSTSVPALAAKPIIDIDVVVPDHRVAAAIDALASIGYVHRGDLGIPQREAFRPPAGLPTHHLYLCPASSPALANHLAVRNFLRSHPESVREYSTLKKRLASEFAHDIDGYIEGKTSFLITILRRSGFPESLIADIEHMNRKP